MSGYRTRSGAWEYYRSDSLLTNDKDMSNTNQIKVSVLQAYCRRLLGRKAFPDYDLNTEAIKRIYNKYKASKRFDEPIKSYPDTAAGRRLYREESQGKIIAVWDSSGSYLVGIKYNAIGTTELEMFTRRDVDRQSTSARSAQWGTPASPWYVPPPTGYSRERTYGPQRKPYDSGWNNKRQKRS